MREMDAYIDGLVQDCSNSSTLPMKLLQSCTKPSIFSAATDILCQRKVTSSSWKCSPVIRSTAHYPLLPQLLLLVHSMTLTAEMGLKSQIKILKLCWCCHLSFPLPTYYQYAVDGVYCTLCVQIVWLVHGANRHDTPWKPALFTSSFWNGQCIKATFTSTAVIKYNFMGQINMTRLAWVERHTLIGWFFIQISFHWLTQNAGLNNPVLSESTESPDNEQLTIGTPVL